MLTNAEGTSQESILLDLAISWPEIVLMDIQMPA
jgi:hypothetical protein